MSPHIESDVTDRERLSLRETCLYSTLRTTTTTAMDIRTLLALVAVVYFLLISVSSLPVSQQKPTTEVKSEEEKKIESEVDDLGLEYGRYLQQVVEALEQDKEFAKKLENVSQDEIKNGAIARELNLVDHNVRNKLDELKRIEIERLRHLARQEQKLQQEDNGERRWRTLEGAHNGANIDADHVDHQNPHSFEAEDLQKLILQATKDLEALDAKRREDFKKYEMEKEIEFRESMVNMTDQERDVKIKEHSAHAQKEHPKVHHPGSKKQLEQVWEEKDGMPVQEFDPKVFFTMHDVNGDGFLDPEEVEAILSVEVKKLYPNDGRSDINEMQEEYHRMREHIYKEADNNKDGLISKKEFLEFTRRMEFERDEGWKGLDEQQVYSEDELKQYQQQRAHNPQEYQQYHDQYQYYQQQPSHHQQPGQHPGQQHYGGQQQYVPVQQYIPPPQQMSAQEWHNLQQQYYQEQLHQQQQQMHVQNQIPNQQLHPQQQQHYQQIQNPNDPPMHPQQIQQMVNQQQQHPQMAHPQQEMPQMAHHQQQQQQPGQHPGQIQGGQQHPQIQQQNSPQLPPQQQQPNIRH